MSFGGAIAILVVIGPIIGYLYGSVLFAVIIGKLFAHKDVRKFESGNPGATNATRVLGNKLGLLVLLLDISKAVLPTLIMWFVFWFGLRNVLHDTGPYFLGHDYFNCGILIYLAGFFAVVGHLFPIYYKFHGGKGIATFGGLLLILSPFMSVVAAIIIIICLWATRYVSLGAVVTVCLVPILILIPGINYIYLVEPNILHFFGAAMIYKYWCLVCLPIMCFLYVLSAMMVYRHRYNIRAIMNGTERKFEAKNRISVFKDNKVKEPIHRTKDHPRGVIVRDEHQKSI